VTTPALPLTPALERRLSGRPLVLFLDVDGTLSPIAPRPEEAVVPDATKQVLRTLASLPDCHVVIVTGRAAGDARRMVDVDDSWLIGNHGIEVAPPRAAPMVRDDIAAFEPTINSAIERAMVLAREIPGVLVENKQWSLTVHFRLATDRIEARLEPAVAAIGRELGLKLIRGKKVFELRPPMDVDKGTAVVSLARDLGALGESASVLCAGDDRTDEDAFRALRAAKPDSVTVRVVEDEAVSLTTTAAEFTLSDPGAMRELLERIVERRRHASTATAVVDLSSAN
jgi:trehalose 6-phosphate phosphatase